MRNLNNNRPWRNNRERRSGRRRRRTRRSGLKTSWRVMCNHQYNLLHLLMHLLLQTPVAIHYQMQGLLLSGAGLTNNPLYFLVKGREAEADVDIR
jgi:hypothetical protein